MKKRRKITAAALAAAVFLSCQPSVCALSVSAESAIVMDAATGQILYEKNADRKSLIASTTKIMTGLLICESGLDLKRECTVPDGAVGIEGSSLYLKKGETIRVETLLYGMLLHSGNDAATALAIVCSGSVEKFVSEMNERAKELGLCATHFANPSGLDSEENYSTARDLATLGAAAMQNPIFSEAVSAKSAQMDGRSFVNHNRLLWQYPGALGIKTGYTKAAGRILVSCAEKNGRMLIAVTVRDANDWADHAALLDGGFSQYRKCTLVQKGDFVGSVAILGGQKSFAALNAERELCVWLLPHEQVRLRLDAPTVAYAPIEEGMAGTLEAQVGGRTIGSVRVDYAQSVPQNAAGDDCAERFFGG